MGLWVSVAVCCCPVHRSWLRPGFATADAVSSQDNTSGFIGTSLECVFISVEKTK